MNIDKTNDPKKVNHIDIGKRLAFYLAKNPEKENEILKTVDISTYTLERYKTGKSPKMPFVDLVKICMVCELNINWLATGYTHIKKEDNHEY